MGIEVVGDATSLNDILANEALLNDSEENVGARKKIQDIDARRRLEDKLEEMRLEKDTQEYDFDL